MVIPNHPGPSAQIFYRDRRPSGHDNPARFCSTWEAFQYDFERQDEGWTRAVFYVTDYSAVDYELTSDAGDLLISTHPEAEAFVDATTVTFVAGSEVKGAMGRDLIGFSEAADAEAFQADHGGDVLTFDEVSRSTIAQLAST
jgi:nitrous oxide reductase accessory protein NosL